MSPQEQLWDRQCLEALKSLGKTLGQMTLYKIGHPAVAATLQLAQDNLAAALADTAQGELSFSIDADKLLCNGRIVGLVAGLPSSVPGLFNRFKLSALSFKTGLTNEELAAFCELCSLRPGAGAPADPMAYLTERGVSRITLNEAVYAKMSGAPDGQAAVAETAGAAEGDPEAEARPILDAVDSRSVESTIQALVGKAVSDPAKRSEVFQKVMGLLKEDIERHIEEVVQPLREERNMLANEQARTQTVLQSTVEGVVMVDEHGKILMMNPAAEQIYGTTLSQVAGQHVSLNAGDEHVVTMAAELTTPKDREINRDVNVSGDDETKRTLKASGAIVQNEQGKVVGMVTSLSDVAKHKEVQRMQRDFIAHVTHELRAPLSSIKAALEILESEVRGKIKEDEGRMLDTAMKNSDRLADLINSILDFSKIESGQMQVYPKKADPESIAREGVDSLAAWASKKRIQLSLAAVPNLPPVLADPPRTVQVLINLLSNAIKFTPVGGSITVRVASPSGGASFAGEKFVQFSVTDTGPGIPKAEQKRIFEKFVQIAAGEMHVGGTGLGLSIAKALIHLQGGKMWVESEPPKGSTFLYTLPIWTAEGAKEAQTAAPAPAAAKPRAWWKKLLGLK